MATKKKAAAKKPATPKKKRAQTAPAADILAAIAELNEVKATDFILKNIPSHKRLAVAKAINAERKAFAAALQAASTVSVTVYKGAKSVAELESAVKEANELTELALIGNELLQAANDELLRQLAKATARITELEAEIENLQGPQANEIPA